MSDRWRLAGTLSVRDWRTLLEAATTLGRAHAALRLRSPAHVLADATRVHPAKSAAPVAAADVRRAAWLVAAAARHLVRVPCLSRSVALARVLARRGVATDIRIGVRTIEGRLEAHAWVEWNGRPLNEDESELRTYAPFTEPLGSLATARLNFR